MNTAQHSKLSLALVFGMVCASVLMLTGNSAAARHDASAPAFHGDTTMVTELPAVVITGKRLSAEEKAQYRQQLAAQGRQVPQA